MPPKKDAAADEPNPLLVGFTNKETKLLAAAFLSSTAPDKFDYDAMATLTGNTAGSLKKMWPPVKKKAIDGHASFAAFLRQAGVAAAAAPAGSGQPKPATPAKIVKKRKAADEVPEDVDDGAEELNPPSGTDRSEADKSDSKKKVSAAKKQKKAPAKKSEPVKGKGRPKKAVKEESASQEESKDKSAEDSADGGDGLGGEAEDDT